MSLFLTVANLTTTGLILASGGQNAAQIQPAAQPPQPTEVKITEIVVKGGDNLSKIAKKYDTTWRQIFDANKNIKNPDIINPGDKLIIPKKDEPTRHRPLPANTVIASTAETSSTKVYKSTTSTSYKSVGGSVWDKLAACESGGNWGINTGNGYYGGLQFTAGTWRSNGGGAYSSLPNQATREQQIKIASKLQASRGWSPWPACSAKLGLL